MNSLKLYKSCYQSPFLPNLHKKMVKQSTFAPNKLVHGRKLAVRACGGLESEKNSERRSFLSLEEAGLVEMSGISTHERFLCRLTVFLS
jgi:hypothetical protein